MRVGSAGAAAKSAVGGAVLISSLSLSCIGLLDVTSGGTTHSLPCISASSA